MSPHGKMNFLYSRKHFLNWYLLAFLSGSVNAGGYLACQRFVSHVTGFATLFGVEIAYWHWWEGLGILSVPLFFLAGSMASALLVERRMQQNRTPHYAVAMGLVMVCLLVTGLGGNAGWFGRFGEPLALRYDYFLLALLCTASGIQNAVITSVSGSVVRTTHLTGITTDLGIGLIRVMFPSGDEHRLHKERQFNRLRTGTICFFILGSTAGAALFAHYRYLAFLMPAGLACYATFAAIFVWQKPEYHA